MKLLKKHLISFAILFSAMSAFAQDANTALATAQKAYVAGNWKDAATAYENACPLQPKEKQDECLLWNILALSQTGTSADFVKAGKRLDSLIQNTDVQNPLYVDFVITRSQFMLYLSKYNRAAENLILAIRNSQERHKAVLQKVCSAVQAKIKLDSLDENCKQINLNGTIPADSTAAPTASIDTVQKQDSIKQPEQQQTTATGPTVSQPDPTPEKASESKAPATEQTQALAASAKPAEGWILQLGAFGVKSNADLLVSNLKKRGIECKIEERAGENKTLYIVQTPFFETKEKAIDFGATKLAPLNIEFRAIFKK